MAANNRKRHKTHSNEKKCMLWYMLSKHTLLICSVFPEPADFLINNIDSPIHPDDFVSLFLPMYIQVSQSLFEIRMHPLSRSFMIKRTNSKNLFIKIGIIFCNSRQIWVFETDNIASRVGITFTAFGKITDFFRAMSHRGDITLTTMSCERSYPWWNSRLCIFPQCSFRYLSLPQSPHIIVMWL